MAVEKKDIEDVAEALGKKFDEFKEKNDKRIDGLEAEKGKLSGQVDTLNEKFTLGFFFVLCIAENITESLILFLGVNVCRSLFGIGGIVDYLTEP